MLTNATTELIHSVLDGEASKAQAQQLQELLAAEPAVRAEFDAAERLFADFKSVPQRHPPEGLVAAVMAAVAVPAAMSSRSNQLSSWPGVIGSGSRDYSVRDFPNTRRNSRFRQTGPDLRVEWGASSENPADHDNVVYDWTVVHATAPSHRGKSLKALFAQKTAEKEALYGEMVRANGEKFVVLCITSHGVLSKQTAAFVRRVAAATAKPEKEVRLAILVALQQGNGGAIAQSRGRRWER